MGMTMNEALVAGTLNAAASIGHSDMYGSLEVGKYGDMLVLDCSQWEHLFYRISDEPIEMVIKKGEVLKLYNCLIQIITSFYTLWVITNS